MHTDTHTHTHTHTHTRTHASHPLRPRLPAPRAQAAASSSSGAASSHSGKAFLHDFCMSIPYATLALVAGLVFTCLGRREAAVHMAGAGAVVCLASILSLKEWRSGNSSMPFTLMSAGAVPRDAPPRPAPTCSQLVACSPGPGPLAAHGAPAPLVDGHRHA